MPVKVSELRDDDPILKALAVNRIQRDCILEAGSVRQGIKVADYILSNTSTEDLVAAFRRLEMSTPDAINPPPVVPAPAPTPAPASTPIPTPSTVEFSRTKLHTALAVEDERGPIRDIFLKALKAAKGLSAKARKELETILTTNEAEPAAAAEALARFADRYRLQLAQVLTQTQLAAILVGAMETGADIPAVPPMASAKPIPPSLGPAEAKELIERLSDLSVEERFKEIYERTPAEQQYLVEAVAAKEAATEEAVPEWYMRDYTTPGEAPGIEEYDLNFPVIEGAVKALVEKNILTPYELTTIKDSARAKAFTIAGVAAEETLTKVRDILARGLKDGMDYKGFRREVLSAVEEGTFMSDAHMETVFRTNTHSALSDGQMAVLQEPTVRNAFPYAMYSPIHDDRTRPEHLALDTLGIGGSNVYRIDDPVFRMFRPPWDYNCRCAWTPMTVRQAAELGVEEAKTWLATGEEPLIPAFVEPPPFTPRSEFDRALTDMALSVRLSACTMWDRCADPVSYPDAGTTPNNKPRPHWKPLPTDEYPRDNAGRFVPKDAIVAACHSEDGGIELRNGLPEGERPKLDAAVAHLRGGGTIYHPKEAPGMAVDASGMIVDPNWWVYDMDVKRYAEWATRNADRTARREALDLSLKELRGPAVKGAIQELFAATTSNSALKRYNEQLDTVNDLLEEAKIAKGDLRKIARRRATIELWFDTGNSADMQEAMVQMAECYEDAIERAYASLDMDEEDDPEPPRPKEPDNAVLGVALGFDVDGFFHGPNPPNEGWVPAGQGPRGGRRWRFAGKRGGKPPPVPGSRQKQSSSRGRGKPEPAPPAMPLQSGPIGPPPIVEAAEIPTAQVAQPVLTPVDASGKPIALTALPSVKAFADAGKLSIVGSPSPATKTHLFQLSKLPTHIAHKLAAHVSSVSIGTGSVVDMDDLSYLKYHKPRSSGVEGGNLSWETAGGVYSSRKKSIAVNDIPTGSVSAILHEAGHAVNDMMGRITHSDAFRELHERAYNDLDPFLQQGGPGGRKGCNELFAESFAAVLMNERQARKDYGDEVVDWMQENIINAQ